MSLTQSLDRIVMGGQASQAGFTLIPLAGSDISSGDDKIDNIATLLGMAYKKYETI